MGETEASVAEIRKILDTRKGPGRDQFVDENKEKVKAEEDAEDCLNAMANGEKSVRYGDSIGRVLFESREGETRKVCHVR